MAAGVQTAIELGRTRMWTFNFVPLQACAPGTHVLSSSASRGATKKARVLRVVGTPTATGTVQLLSGATDLTGAMTWLIGMPFPMPAMRIEDVALDGVPVAAGSDANMVLVTSTMNGFALIAVEN